MIGKAEKIVALRYAKALLIAAEETGAFQVLEEELSQFSAFILDEGGKPTRDTVDTRRIAKA